MLLYFRIVKIGQMGIKSYVVYSQNVLKCIGRDCIAVCNSIDRTFGRFCMFLSCNLDPHIVQKYIFPSKGQRKLNISNILLSEWFQCFFVFVTDQWNDNSLLVIVSHLIFFILKWTEGGASVDFIFTFFIKQNKT